MAKYTIEKALPSDAEAIASVSTSNEPTPFRRLMAGTSNGANERRRENIDSWIKSIEHPLHLVLVAREEGMGGKVVSFAQWVRPRDRGDEVVVRSEEEKKVMHQKRLASIKPGQNGPLLLRFWDNVETLGNEGFGGRRRWYLNNVATLAAHRGRGLASRLVTWPFAEADREGVAVALFTDRAGAAKRLYERLGFAETARFEIDLAEFGGTGRHVEVAMIREPAEKGESA